MTGVLYGRLIVLAAAGGWLDAAALLRAHVFVANMTGNTVLLGLGIGHHPPGSIVKPLVALASFAFGAFAGSALTERGPSAARAAERALVVETALLALFAALWYVVSPTSPALLAIIAIGACAMGVQQTATRRMHPDPPVSTTYQGGTIERLGVGAFEMFKRKPRTLFVNGAIWIAYLFSAVAVALLGNSAPQLLGIIPFAAVLALAVSLALVPRSRANPR